VSNNVFMLFICLMHVMINVWNVDRMLHNMTELVVYDSGAHCFSVTVVHVYAVG